MDLFKLEQPIRQAMIYNELGDLVPSLDLDGKAQVQIAGNVKSIRPKADTYVNAQGETKEWYACSVEVLLNGKLHTVQGRINGSGIENVEKGEAYWFTMSRGVTKDGVHTTNYVTGGLAVRTLNDTVGAEAADAFLASLTQQSAGLTA
jgi:hypothetical protein